MGPMSSVWVIESASDLYGTTTTATVQGSSGSGPQLPVAMVRLCQSQELVDYPSVLCAVSRGGPREAKTVGPHVSYAVSAICFPHFNHLPLFYLMIYSPMLAFRLLRGRLVKYLKK